MNPVHLFPDLTPQVGIPCFLNNALHFSSPQSVDDSFVVHMDRGGTFCVPTATQRSSWCAAPRVQHPKFRAFHALAPSPRRDQAAPPTTHTHSTSARLRARSQPVATGIHQLWCLSDSHSWTVKWLLLQLLPPRGCDVIPHCHFQSSFDVLALCSHFPKPSWIWFLSSLHDGQWYSLCFSVPSSLLQPRHFFSSDQ